MDIVVRILSFIASISSFATAVYVFTYNVRIRKLQLENKRIGEYIKDKNFLFMQDCGEDTFDAHSDINAPKVIQNCEYLVKRQ